MTKDGKLDVSFLRVDKTKKEIPPLEDEQVLKEDGLFYGIGVADYFTTEIIKNGFYHPKKSYVIIYQDSFRDEEGQLGGADFKTPKGIIGIYSAVAYKGGREWYVIFHEIIHSLGFIQGCAPGRVDMSNITHLKYSNDVMSDKDSSAKLIDGKRSEYYDHSNENCQMDLRKSVFLEPTEKNSQLKPRAPNNSACRMSGS